MWTCPYGTTAMIQKFRSQSRYRQIVGKSMWVDRLDIRCCVGRAAQRLGKARQCDMANVIGVHDWPESAKSC